MLRPLKPEPQHSVSPPPLPWPSPTALMREISSASARYAWKATTTWTLPNSRLCSIPLPVQLLSPQNLAGDRDALLTEYLSRGFDQVQRRGGAAGRTSDPSKVDVVFHITEGPQIFVRNVLVTGLHYTRPDTVARAITLHAGDPLNQTALLDTQRNLYELALFNEVDAAIENPTGGETRKTVLLQAVEARRWALTYGFGFEAQTGTPQNNCAGAIAGGVACNPNGKTGVSPRVLADITRNNLFGREQSASLQGTYGLLEQKIDLLYQVPHFEGNRNFGITFSGGYANSQDVTTYVASRLEAGFRLTESFQSPGSWLSKANTFIYEYDFRRVKVAASSLQVFPGEIQELATAVRVAGPGVTWIRDTRDSPLDAHRGTYTSFQEFLSVQPARLRGPVQQARSFQLQLLRLRQKSLCAGPQHALRPGARLWHRIERAHSATRASLFRRSHLAARLLLQRRRPRDPETGFPIGGAGALVNTTELRLPPPTLPWLGDTVSFVLFHDMGNVFTNAGDAWASSPHFNQPNRDACKTLASSRQSPQPSGPTNGPVTSTGHQGICSFNYFSHTPGIGLRYHTPVGPIRLDFSYNLNTPIYPVNVDYSLSESRIATRTSAKQSTSTSSSAWGKASDAHATSNPDEPLVPRPKSLERECSARVHCRRQRCCERYRYAPCCRPFAASPVRFPPSPWPPLLPWLLTVWKRSSTVTSSSPATSTRRFVSRFSILSVEA